jgi:hypothetical protein
MPTVPGTDNALTTTCPSPWSSSDDEPRPVIRTRQLEGGDRLSTVRRADGSTFSVLVPAWAFDDGGTAARRSGPWIVEVGGRRPPTEDALRRLGGVLGLRSEQHLGLSSVDAGASPLLDPSAGRSTGTSRLR